MQRPQSQRPSPYPLTRKAAVTKVWANWSCPRCLRLHPIRLYRVSSQQAVIKPMTQLPVPPVPRPFQQTGRSVRAALLYDLSTLASIPTQCPLLSHSMDPAAGNRMEARRPIKALLGTQLQKTKRRGRSSHLHDPNHRLPFHLPKAPHLTGFSLRHRGSHNSAKGQQPLNLKTAA